MASLPWDVLCLKSEFVANFGGFFGRGCWRGWRLSGHAWVCTGWKGALTTDFGRLRGAAGAVWAGLGRFGAAGGVWLAGGWLAGVWRLRGGRREAAVYNEPNPTLPETSLLPPRMIGGESATKRSGHNAETDFGDVSTALSPLMG